MSSSSLQCYYCSGFRSRQEFTCPKCIIHINESKKTDLKRSEGTLENLTRLYKKFHTPYLHNQRTREREALQKACEDKESSVALLKSRITTLTDELERARRRKVQLDTARSKLRKISRADYDSLTNTVTTKELDEAQRKLHTTLLSRSVPVRKAMREYTSNTKSALHDLKRYRQMMCRNIYKYMRRVIHFEKDRTESSVVDKRGSLKSDLLEFFNFHCNVITYHSDNFVANVNSILAFLAQCIQSLADILKIPLPVKVSLLGSRSHFSAGVSDPFIEAFVVRDSIFSTEDKPRPIPKLTLNGERVYPLYIERELARESVAALQAGVQLLSFNLAFLHGRCGLSSKRGRLCLRSFFSELHTDSEGSMVQYCSDYEACHPPRPVVTNESIMKRQRANSYHIEHKGDGVKAGGVFMDMQAALHTPLHSKAQVPVRTLKETASIKTVARSEHMDRTVIVDGNGYVLVDEEDFEIVSWE